MDRKLKILFLLLLSFNFLKAQVVYPPAGAGGTNLDVSGTASPLTVRSSTGTDIDLIGGTNTTLVGTPTSITINSTSGGDILNGGNTTGAAVTIGTNDNNALNFETNSVTRLTVANGATTGGALTSTNVNANTGTAVDALTLSTNSTGTPVAGFGTGILFKAESNTTNDREIARFYTYYTDPTNATPSTAASIDLRNAGSLAETFRFEPAGILKVGSTSPTDFGKSGITTGVAFTVGNSANDLTIGGNSGVVDINSSGAAAAIKLNASGTTSYIEVGGTANATNTSGQKASMWFPQGYSASTGTGIFTGIYLNGTINQTGSANGLTAGIFIDQPVTAAADYSGLLIGTTGATTKAIHQTSSTATNIIRGKTAFGTSTAPTAHLHLESGSTILAPFKFTQGSNLTTPEPGAVEWNGTNLFITQTSGPTRKQIAYTTDITSGYTTMQEEGAGLTARAILNFIGSSATAADDGSSKTNVTFDSDLNALASTASTGLYSVTGTGTSAVRTITGPAAGITVSNGNGVSGNPTLALANDLSAVEGLATNGIPARTATDTWAIRTITAGTGISVTNGDGVAGNPTISATAGGESVITPSQITTHPDPYNPTNLSTATMMRLSGDASFRGIQTMTAPSVDKVLRVMNIGTNTLAFQKNVAFTTNANRFDFIRDLNLLPNESATLYYDLTAARWKLISHEKIPLDKRRRTMGFLPSTTSASASERWTWASGSGHSVAYNIPSSSFDDLTNSLVIGTGTTTTGAGYLSSKSLSTVYSVPAASAVYFSARIYIPTASDATDTYAVEVGMKASAGIGVTTNGFFFRYTHSENSGNWRAVSTVSGVGTATNTSDPGISGAYQQLELIKRSNGFIGVYINGVWRTDMSYSGTVDLQPVILITKSAGTTTRNIEISDVFVEGVAK